MRHTAILAAALAALLALAAPARAGMVEDCVQGRDPDLTISGCTAVIRSGQYSGRNLVVAYYSRGLAYHRLGDPARGIEDFDRAIRLDPGLAIPYNDRGAAYHKLGEHARAIEDYDQALRLNPGFAIAYDNRAIARCRLGQVEASVSDRMQAIRLGAFTAKDVQSYLRDRGFYKGAIDGNFGPASQQALRDWTAAGCPQN